MSVLHLFIAVNWVIFLIYVATGIQIDRYNQRRSLKKFARKPGMNHDGK